MRLYCIPIGPFCTVCANTAWRTFGSGGPRWEATCGGPPGTLPTITFSWITLASGKTASKSMPDLTIGMTPMCSPWVCGGMTEEEYRTQMSLWCILAAPLFASNDLTKMSPETLAMLTNREVIAVNQDPAGIQGHRVWQEGPTEIWVKPLADGSKAVGIFNRNEVPMTITLDFQDVGVQAPAQVRDLWTHKDLGTLDRSYSSTVPTHGVVMLKIYK